MTNVAIEEEVVKTDDGAQTCANTACNCATEVGSRFCSDVCEKEEFELVPRFACACGHIECVDLSQDLGPHQGEEASPP